MAHDNHSCNRSKNISFSSLLQSRLSRRSVLAGGVSAAVGTFFSTHGFSEDGAQSDQETSLRRRQDGLVGFKPVPIAEGRGPWPHISSDYQFQIILPWGDPIEPNGPVFQWPLNAADQARQLGAGHDGMCFFPIRDAALARGGWQQSDWGLMRGRKGNLGNEHGLLVINHEFGRNHAVLGKSAPESLDDVRLSQHAHGVSIVELQKRLDEWQTVKSGYARRIHVNTDVEFSGPVAGHALLKTPAGNRPQGTLNNCSMGYTPWGTYLTCEENFNGYFGATKLAYLLQRTEEQKRYGFDGSGFGYGWHEFDKRFDLSNPDYKNEENRFGWVVEIDPFDPDRRPIKRTALGRFKHEGAAVAVGKNERVAVYMGDDQGFDYIYKFVSANSWQRSMEQGNSPLDEGALFVARFNEDGTGEWLELTIENPVLADRFTDQAEVLTFARIAGDLLGATPMDRPEWTTVAPNGDVFCSLTSNVSRLSSDAANPSAPNFHGHIIKWRDSEDHTGVRFSWDIFLMAEETHDSEACFSNPDGLWADPDGRLFILTDGRQKEGLNNQLLVADTLTGEVRRLFTGVDGDELTGITLTPDRRTLFVNIQHPGKGDPSRTNFPAPFDGKTRPRDATLVITRKDGGIIGS